jgi:aminopeptidase N
MEVHPGVERLALLPLLVACAQASVPSAAFVGAMAAAGGCERSTALSLLSHDVELEVSLDPPTLVGNGIVRVRATQPTAVVGLDAKELAVRRFLVESQEVDFERTPALVCATLPAPLAAGDERTLRVEWRLEGDRNMPKFSQNEVFAGYQTSAWMPTLQDAAQRATLVLHVTASTPLKVGASGRLQERQRLPGERTRHTFMLDRPAPPFLYAFAVGRFDEEELRVDDMLLRAFGPPGADLTPALEATASIHRFLNDKLGVPHPWREYLQVFVDEDVAQEAAGMALIGARALRDLRANPQDDWVLSHELSHQWFGWLVPCADFADFWLNEGFATFMVGAFKQAQWGTVAYEQELGNWRRRSAAVRAQGRDAPIALSSPEGAARAAPSEGELQARGVTYFRGALVLHRLRAELGEETFWRGIRSYVTSHAGQSVRTSDLRRSLEAASQRDLGEFFERWIYSVAADP